MRKAVLALACAIVILPLVSLPRPAAAQTVYPTGIAVNSNNGTLSIDSAINVQEFGAPVGPYITYYVNIPAS